nr:hypothetical protein [Tanacetum cinerariifolium]
MIRTEFGRIITTNIDDMTIAEYMEYEAEMKKDPWRYTRNLGLTTMGGTKSLENIHQPDKLKTNDYFPSVPTCFKPTQLRTDDIHKPSGNNPNDYHLFTPQFHYETEEVIFDEDVDEWLNKELSKRMTGHDKEEEKDSLIGILKTVVEQCKSIYKKAQIRTPSSKISKIQGVFFVAKEEEGDISETLPYQQPSNEINPRSFTLPCTIGNLKIYAMADVGAGINMMPKSLFEHLKFANRKKTSMTIKMVIDTLEEPDETILLDGQDAIWKSQRSVHGLALVKSWKLLTSCGVHIITLTTIQLILLVERRYPLLKFTLEQLPLELMLSKRSRKNTKCVNAADEELTAAKHKLVLLVYCC